MGIHLILERGGEELPPGEFDGLRYAGDSDLASDAESLSKRHWFVESELQHYYVLDPAKVREWGAALDYNQERWETIASLFEKYPDLQMRVSY